MLALPISRDDQRVITILEADFGTLALSGRPLAAEFLHLTSALVKGRVCLQLQWMTRPALLEEILHLPPEERLRLVEDIWDSLAVSIADVPVPDWHRAELERRLMDPSEQATVSWDELQTRLLSKLDFGHFGGRC